MQIEERSVGDVAILDLTGKRTLGGEDTLLKDKVRSLLMQGRRQIVVNLADVPSFGQCRSWGAGQRVLDGHP